MSNDLKLFVLPLGSSARSLIRSIVKNSTCRGYGVRCNSDGCEPIIIEVEECLFFKLVKELLFGSAELDEFCFFSSNGDGVLRPIVIIHPTNEVELYPTSELAVRFDRGQKPVEVPLDGHKVSRNHSNLKPQLIKLVGRTTVAMPVFAGKAVKP